MPHISSSPLLTIRFIIIVVVRPISVPSVVSRRPSSTGHVILIRHRVIIATALLVIIIPLPAELVRPGGHAQVLCDRSLVIALGTRNGLILLILESLTLHVVIAEAHLTAQTRVLAQLIAGFALIALGLQHLTRSLVFELVIFTEERIAEATLEHATTMVPYATLALHTDRILE